LKRYFLKREIQMDDKYFSLFIVFILMFLNGCGGSGGSNLAGAAASLTSPPICPNGTIKAPTNQSPSNLLCDAPKLVSISPANNASDVSVETFAGVAVTTDSPLDITSINVDNIKLSASGINVSGVVTTVGTNGLRFTTSTKLNYGQKYTFTASVKDLLGKSFIQVINFSTKPIVCNSPLSVIDNGNACGIPLLKTSYENKNFINFDETQVFTVRSLGIPRVYANEQDTNERSVAFADFFQEGKYSAFVSTNRSANLYKNPDINDIPGVAYFLSQDAKGIWRDRTSELIKKLEDRSTCVNTSYSIIADFNNDGKPDVYIACSGVDYDISSLGYSSAELQERYTSNQLLYLSQADGTYKRIEVPFRIYAHQAAAADIDGDGFIDIVTISAADPNLLKVAVLLGHGDGTFTQTFDKNIVPSPSNIETLHNVWGVALIPIDGRLDLILNGGPPFASYWVKGNGKGGFDFGSVRKILMSNSTKTKSQYSFPLDTVYDGGNFYYYTTSQLDPPAAEWAIVKFNINSSSYQTIYSWDNPVKTFQSFSGQFKPTASGNFVAYTGGCGAWNDPAYPITGVLSKIGGCAMNVKFK